MLRCVPHRRIAGRAGYRVVAVRRLRRGHRCSSQVGRRWQNELEGRASHNLTMAWPAGRSSTAYWRRPKLIEVVDVRYDAGRFGSGYKDRPKSDASIRALPMAEPVALAMARRLEGCGWDELVFCGPGGSNGVPRGVHSRLSVGNYWRVYRLAVARAELPELDRHGPHDLRHTFATWLEDGAVPARVIDELMGHQAGRRGEREGSMMARATGT
jgi:integrase